MPALGAEAPSLVLELWSRASRPQPDTHEGWRRELLHPSPEMRPLVLLEHNCLA